MASMGTDGYASSHSVYNPMELCAKWPGDLELSLVGWDGLRARDRQLQRSCGPIHLDALMGEEPQNLSGHAAAPARVAARIIIP